MKKEDRQMRNVSIIELRKQGKSVSEIAKELNTTDAIVYTVVKSVGMQRIKLKPATEMRACKYCGSLFLVPSYSNKLYCCADHEKKTWRERAKNNPKADDSHVAEMVRTRAPGWEYVGGYTGSDGTVEIRHKVCGTTTIKSVTTIRHGRKLICTHCEDLKREAKEKAIAEAIAEARAKAKAERHAKAIENKKKRYAELKLPKAKPIVKCRVCGQWFYGKSKASCICSDECNRKVLNHEWDMKKDARRRKARTKETKTITLQKLFERDGGICWICGKPCDITAHHNDNNYPSVDHVMPISKGGKDEWENIKLAHRICNSLRGNSIYKNF